MFGVNHECFNMIQCAETHSSCSGGGPKTLQGQRPETELVVDSNQEEEVLHGLLEQVAAGSVSAAVTLTELGGDRLRVNAKRRSLQLSSACSTNRMIANVPLSDSQWAAISRT